MKVECEENAEDAARRAAEIVEEMAQAAIAQAGVFYLALSGGNTPSRMFDFLAESRIDWQRVRLFQVDERIAPQGDGARNLSQLNQHLLGRLNFPPDFVPLPVNTGNLVEAVQEYSRLLPSQFDLIHLGLGADGHTASLVPDDDALESVQQVAQTKAYQGHKRLTLTFPVLNSAKMVLMLATGADKRQALSGLLNRDPDIPASRLWPEQFVVVTDREAFG